MAEKSPLPPQEKTITAVEKTTKRLPKRTVKRANYKKLWKLGSKEFNTTRFDISKNDELVIREGNYEYNVHNLVKKYGSSMEVFMPTVLEDRLNSVITAFDRSIKNKGYKGKFTYHYPMKVNQNREFVLSLVAEGAHLEVGSPNELWLVKQLWKSDNFYRKMRVLCNGPKTEPYIKLINELRSNGLTIVPIIEDLNELEALKKFKGDVGIRINLVSKVKSRWDKKIDRFGLLSEEILELGKIKNLKILHYHIGSQIEKEADILVALREAFKTYVKLKELNPTLDTMDLGGGLAVPYEKKKLYHMENVVRRIVSTLKTLSDEAGIQHPNIIVEWGRYVAAPAQFSVFRVVGSKEIPNGKTAKDWYIIDGSFMTDLLDTWSIHQKWHIIPVNNLREKKRHRVWLAGLSCDSDDKYTASDGYLLLPHIDDLEEGESQYIAIFDTGAYQDAFAMHHCLLSSPIKIAVQNGIVSVARERETAEDVGKLFGW